MKKNLLRRLSVTLVCVLAFGTVVKASGNNFYNSESNYKMDIENKINSEVSRFIEEKIITSEKALEVKKYMLDFEKSYFTEDNINSEIEICPIGTDEYVSPPDMVICPVDTDEYVSPPDIVICPIDTENVFISFEDYMKPYLELSDRADSLDDITAKNEIIKSVDNLELSLNYLPELMAKDGIITYKQALKMTISSNNDHYFMNLILD